ncbi:ead/Ea22-like family protein [Escherichia coli]|uniref:ead/Ea22-like family protein n=1 Tax=Escherichia coli TaxID=562 RepID=UPI0019A0DFF1|nr:ead/Ea22-like family protein [Escherichia coli]CAD6036718.1 prophage protein [Escherichia coli]CAD6098831.1 prophage protein [Escherichia coli]CAD6176512.1 prophage protein [Escherichia coli]
MSDINHQALREVAEAIKIAATTQKLLAFRVKVTPQVVLTLLDELDSANGYASAYEAEKWHYHSLAESEGERADRAEKQVGELAMLVKQLVSQLKKVKPDCKLPDKAMDYLERNGLVSAEDVLR